MINSLAYHLTQRKDNMKSLAGRIQGPTHFDDFVQALVRYHPDI